MNRENLKKAISIDHKIKDLVSDCMKIRDLCEKSICEVVNGGDYRGLIDKVNNTIQDFFDIQLNILEKEFEEL